ncbi:MAG TPA: maleylpyruvate isomerase family mycothiol-dependent enzyme [Acidimicrobiales bacterium]|nr:maleylpyruvate isomerase family mycothiol-dependent enzyme [Acidimicrobiales bacterium]
MTEAVKAWQMIHAERSALADTLAGLSPEQWSGPSLCAGWSVKLAAAHVLAGAEQTPLGFFGGMAASGFRFNTMMDRDAHRLGALPTGDIVQRLRARTSTTNRPPATVVTLLGEVVVHGADIREPLGLETTTPADAVLACLDLYKAMGFPLGSKKRIEGFRLVATDADWSHGSGPEVAGPAMSLMLAMAGRRPGADRLGGEGGAVLRDRLAAANGGVTSA